MSFSWDLSPSNLRWCDYVKSSVHCNTYVYIGYWSLLDAGREISLIKTPNVTQLTNCTEDLWALIRLWVRLSPSECGFLLRSLATPTFQCGVIHFEWVSLHITFLLWIWISTFVKGRDYLNNPQGLTNSSLRAIEKWKVRVRKQAFDHK